MDIVAIINYKGGVGKTTTTANLAAELAWRGRKVLLLDMDAQASLTFSLVTPDYWGENLEKAHTIKNWFDALTQGNNLPALTDLIIQPTTVNRRVSSRGGRIDLLPSHLGLINVDLELATLLGGASLSQAKRNYLKAHGKLRDALNELRQKNYYDVVLVDCPPNFNVVTKNAIIASDHILIPAKPDYLSTLGIDYLKRNLQQLVTEFNEYALIDDKDSEINPSILGVVFTMIQIRDQQPIQAQRQFIAQTKRLGIPVFEEYIRENKTIFADAPQDNVPVVLNRYSGKTYTDIVHEMENLVTEFERKLSI